MALAERVVILLWAEAIWWSYEELRKVVLVQASFENVNIFCGYNFGGKCIPDFYSANREEIGIESLKGWPRKLVEVENVKKLLRVMMMLL